MSIFTRTSRMLRPPVLVALLIVAAPFVSGAAAWADAVSPSSPLDVQVTADKMGTVDRQTGEVTVTGTIVCRRPANAFVTNIATQVDDGQESSGGWGYNLDCSPTPTAFVATFTSCCGPAFTPGKATLTTAAYVYDYEQGALVTDTASRVVHLKKS
ncbi:MAG: hypothetical protein QOI99_742 [Actinomycetota bacterium]|nr:hypothetical protein [Actinomycetota bacterium]